MIYFLADQSVNDIRFLTSVNAALITFGPGTLVDSLSNTPSRITWT